jgi:hypothetical protein
VSEPSEIRVNLPFRGRQLAEFLAIKEHLGIQTSADVVRYLVHRYARELRQRDLTQGREGARTQGGEADARSTQRREGAGTQGGEADTPGLLCLDCPLPECDEGDPRCAYQQATGERDRKRARTRAYMRRVRK